MKKQTETIPGVFDELLSLGKIGPAELEALSPDKRSEFIKVLYDKLATLSGWERDAFIEKTGELLDKEQLWEYNHSRITLAINKHVKEYGAMPSKAHLAASCGLSRKTIHKHMKNFANNAAWTDQTDTINIMTQNVMGMVLRSALTGDLKAAKLYLDAAKGPKTSETVVNNQNNYIQINKTVINQQLIQQLKPEQLLKIEQIIADSEAQSNDH